MASTILSSASYLNYLNDYINIILNYTDQNLIENLNKSYFDEIETYARSILTQWHSEELIDKQASLYIENVGYLNRKIALLTKTYSLNEKQFERIEDLLCNSEIIQLIISIIESLLITNVRHKDNFLRYLSILIDSFSSMKYSKSIFNEITQQVIESKYYKQYLIELISSSDIQSVHLFFIGAISQLTSPIQNLTINELYSKFLTTFYNEKYFPNNIDLHYCTLGILSQLQISFLINDYSCISTLISIFIHVSTEYNKIFLLPILNLFNRLCIQSKTVACYLNTDELIDILLQYVTNQQDYQIHIQTCLLLGHIISEKQIIQFRINYKLTMKLINLLQYHKHEITNILNSLLSLVIHEQIQFIIAHTYQLIYFIQLCKDYPIVYDIIWKLSFHSDIIDQLITRHDDFLKQLPTLPAAQGILQNVQIKNSCRSPLTNGVSYDISLISSSKDHFIVKKIEENLLKHNFHIGTTLNSSCILLCVSEESKHDSTCQAAIRQAVLDCKKIILCIVRNPYRIDDWFNTLNIQERKSLNVITSSIEKILPEIEKNCRNNHHLPAITKRTRIVSPPSSHRTSQETFTLSPEPQQSPVEILPMVPIKKIQNWTNQEVITWCENNKLNAFSKILTHYDGRNLLALAHVSRMSAPHTIINQLRNDCRKQGLRLSFVEFVRFQAALDELLRLERNILRKQSISTLANRYVYKGKIAQQT
ncbi:unnamed protein product [Adineta steineri]|uniref:SAM domain-containing protein n=1 Tax=Adineta steineri TaxID=433720 RepID=A0A814HMT6_9BILA|nr:unnamed protein product [Adineta steineri]